MGSVTPLSASSERAGRPRVGFLGVGWIGRDRMRAIVESRTVEPAAIVDPSPEMAAAASELAPEAAVVSSLDALLDERLDGIVIATPSALHAAQSIMALDRGIAVFCQKPLGRSRNEAAAVIEAARRADRLLAVDLSYRYTSAMQKIRNLIVSGELGTVFAVDLTFHNAFGPGKPWFYDKALSGGGCVIDLGVHLIDLLLWTLDFPDVVRVESSLFSNGAPIRRDSDKVEDYAVATIELSSGVIGRVACSWRLHAGWEAIIAADFYGTEGGASLRNVNGSFLDFTAERHRGTERELLVSPPDRWGGRAAAAWAQRLAATEGFDRENENLITVADVLDRIYGR
ncbi:Gfo/Idh/MocA family oxidoreductase [Ensifer sp. MPMI2T]|nr:Gfo/Idh/MocA family oxidoreductase [Ensifer sp. MPMI2T]